MSIQSDQHGIVAHFDGAQQGGVCGAGMLIIIDKNLHYRFKMNIGPGTNTKAELLALWGLLHFAKTKDILPVIVYGDSKVIVD